MRRNSHFAFAVLVMFIYVESACNCGLNGEDTYSLTIRTEDYFTRFADGSYWVYQEVGADSLPDTLFLRLKSDSLILEPDAENCPADYHQNVTYWLVSSSGDSLFHKARTHNNLDFFDGYGRYKGLGYAPSFMINKHSLGFNPLSEATVELIPSMEVHNRTFFNVVKLTRPHRYWLEEDEQMIYYYGFRSGLIKFELYNNELHQRHIFELVESELH